MTDKTPNPLAMDGFVTRSDGLLNRPTSQIRARPAPPAPINPKPAQTTAAAKPPVKSK